VMQHSMATAALIDTASLISTEASGISSATVAGGSLFDLAV
jgi:hypothetical protein